MEEFSKKYGILAIAGLMGAVVKRFRKKMSHPRFLGTIGVSIFVAVVSGIFIREWTEFPEEVIFACCGVAGVFSDEILDEVLEVIKSIGEFAKKWIGKKINNEEDSTNNN
ncbi:phage holin family protein [Chryseobacterium sp. NRRL B-14859]|uniref:phage holin family protein n=1 Tax=Chryseobacterium sp. NRRL B-14859 TaxID=1562763 RepID=UPI003393BFB9